MYIKTNNELVRVLNYERNEEQVTLWLEKALDQEGEKQFESVELTFYEASGEEMTYRLAHTKELLRVGYTFSILTEKEKAMEQEKAALLATVAQVMTDEQALVHADIWEKWQANKAYKGVLILGYEGALYSLIQAHTSQADQTPDKLPALWRKLEAMEDGIEEWQQPTGAQDAPNQGDLRRHEGVVYKSLIDGNTTVPGSDPRWWQPI